MPVDCRCAGAARARIDLAPGVRMAVHGRYLVFYRDLPADNAVRVERVLHGARNLPRLL
jgi:toxin ParE1/3/4